MKVIIFDFDGTLTKKEFSIWKQMWLKSGHEIGENSLYRKLFNKFLNHEITYLQWCDLICEQFQNGGFTLNMLKQLTSKIKLQEGFEETVNTLFNNGYQLHIVSGNVEIAIKNTLGEYAKYFTSINGNKMLFNNEGKLEKIVATKYDYLGKCTFVNEIINKNNINEKDILYIGNGANDEWVHLSGCNTLCINPYQTKSDDKTIWHNKIENLTNLKQILNYLDLKMDKEK
jgi:HAD superfamily phosphoserine phosphatase-like hydrolase